MLVLNAEHTTGVVVSNIETTKRPRKENQNDRKVKIIHGKHLGYKQKAEEK